MSGKNDAFVIGMAGIGGYATQMSDLLFKFEGKLSPAVRLAAVCDPDLDRHAERIVELRGHGVEVFDTFEKLLAVDEIEAVWLPLPIALHRPFAEQALAAGKAVICEKPAAGTVDEVDAMIAARDRTGLPAIIGFQNVYDSTTLPLKRRILAGEIGAIRRVTLHACWPRTKTYFGRSPWAGRMRHNGTWVLDSPANNALAHYLNIAMFLLGPDEATSATPTSVEAELYRAAEIENFDTMSARVQFEEGFEMLALLTHACESTQHPVLRIEGERGSIDWTPQQIGVHAPAGDEQLEREGDMRVRMLHAFAGLVRGKPDPETSIASLEVARQHTLLINGLAEATPVHTVPEATVRVAPHGECLVRCVPGIEAAFAQCVANFQMLHESGLLDFTRPAGTRDLRGYTRFAGPHPDNQLADAVH